MSVNNATVELTFNDVDAGVALNCAMYLYDVNTLFVYYGLSRTLAVYGEDYTVSALASPWNAFTVTPTIALVDKITEADDGEVLYVRRRSPLVSTFTAADANFRYSIALEFDKQLVLLQELSYTITSFSITMDELLGLIATAQTAADDAQAAYVSMNDRYLGPKAVAPTLDNSGNTLVQGTLYFDTAFGEMRVYHDSAWMAAYIAADGYATESYVDTAIGALTKTSVGLSNVDNTSDANKPVSTAQATAIAGKAAKGAYDAIRDIAGTADTLVLADAGNVLVRSTNAAATAITVPPQSSVAWPARTQIDIGWFGAGEVSIVAGLGVTIVSEDGMLTLNKRYSAATLIRIAADTWWLVGSLKA